MVTCLGLTMAREMLPPVLLTTVADRSMVYCEPEVAAPRQGEAPLTVACTLNGMASTVSLDLAMAGRSWICTASDAPGACAWAAGTRAAARRAAATRRRDRRDIEG